MSSLAGAVKEFLLHIQAEGVSAATTSWYASLLGAFSQAYEGASVHELSAHQVREYVVGLRRRYSSQDTVSAHVRALHRFWRWASTEYGIPSPMRGMKYPARLQPKPRAARLEDIAAMFSVAGDSLAGARNRAILAFLLDTGCRAQGVVNLRPCDVDLVWRRALVTEKGGKTRAVVFTAYTAQLIGEWLAARAPAPTLFYNLDTLEPLTRNGLYQALRRLARKAGVRERFNPHSFRHTFAREYIRAGGDLATLSKLLGHRDVSTTVAHYAVFTDEEIAAKHERYSPVRQLTESEEAPRRAEGLLNAETTQNDPGGSLGRRSG